MEKLKKQTEITLMTLFAVVLSLCQGEEEATGAGVGGERGSFDLGIQKGLPEEESVKLILEG